jgi:hypothetical protein
MLMKSPDTTIVVQRNWGVWGVTVIRGVATTSVVTAVEDAEVNRDVTMMAMHTRRSGRVRIVVRGAERHLRT